MIPDPDCPTCSERRWTEFGTRTYRLGDATTLRGWSRKAMGILFEAWLPGKTEFRAEFVGCENCGLMIYRPRPSAEDISAKYARSAQMGDNAPSKQEPPARTRQRQRRLFDLVAPHLPAGRARLLDFGGGDGRLLRDFVERGVACDIIDYCETPVAGVRHVGRTEADLPEAEYDVIICSHVVEHLPEPRQTLEKLRAALKLEGVIYVEVPVEMVGRLPAKGEPVTHINFFTTASLAALLREAGYRVRASELNDYPHPNGGWALCASGFASPGLEERIGGELDVLKTHIRPSLSFRLRIARMTWRDYPFRIGMKLKRALRRR